MGKAKSINVPVESGTPVREISKKEGSFSEKGFIKIRNNERVLLLRGGHQMFLRINNIGYWIIAE